jgi:hypothetical protein
MAVLERELADAAPQPNADAIPASLWQRGGSPRHVLIMSLIGTVVLGLFASRDLSFWAQRLSGGPLVEEVQSVTALWDEAAAALGLVLPQETLRSAVRRFLDCDWEKCPIHPFDAGLRTYLVRGSAAYRSIRFEKFSARGRSATVVGAPSSWPKAGLVRAGLVG